MLSQFHDVLEEKGDGKTSDPGQKLWWGRRSCRVRLGILAEVLAWLSRLPGQYALPSSGQWMDLPWPSLDWM